ncbi:MAG: GAF domain-containing protein, partial [Candidatus Omnitrophica bacterium]|nr:GAF domain-containing protein [Candidatus Omnitrophota bacterium]
MIMLQSPFEKFTQPELFKKVADICASVNLVVHRQELLEISLRQTLELFDANRGSIFILENGKDLILKAAQGMGGIEGEQIVKTLGEGVVGRVAISKKPIVVEDISRDERFINYQARRNYRSPSFICAPLLVKDQLIGVINISDKTSLKPFSNEELLLLDFLASQMALNYRRIELYQKFKSIVKESKDLKDRLGQSNLEANHLKKQIFIQERFVTIGKLAGGIAHEFNNPLDGVLRYTNLCLEHVEKDDVVYGYLIEVKHGLNRMANIVRSLLACSRNGGNNSSKKISINKTIEQVLQSLKNEITHKKITIKNNFSTNIPQIPDLGLERAVTNLIRNAMDAINHPLGEIRIGTFLEDQHAIITIEDNGIGIPQENIEKIFEPFFTTKDIDRGCGLGLTIVSEVIKSYAGE